VRAEVSVVIPSLRGGRGLVDLVRSLLEERNGVEFLIADNGMPGETVEALRHLGARVVPFGRNVGFAAAVNGAASRAEGEALVILNDDIVPREGLIEALVEPLGRVEMTAGVLLQGGRPDTIESAGIVVDALLAPHDYLYGESLSRLSEPLPPPLGPCGAAGAFLRRSYDAVGGFDERLFAYCEDVDLALRLHAAGARCALAPGALAVHAGSGTLGPSSLEKARLVGFGRGYLLRKYGVLGHPLIGPAAVSVELAAGIAQAGRHRSLDPLLERLRGWRSCSQRAPRPPRSLATVGLADGLRRRRARSRAAPR
jgi:N-acetylglucosaminyl-diphospho-decaprenol L-rhamnosyltransferase